MPTRHVCFASGGVPLVGPRTSPLDCRNQKKHRSERDRFRVGGSGSRSVGGSAGSVVCARWWLLFLSESSHFKASRESATYKGPPLTSRFTPPSIASRSAYSSLSRKARLCSAVVAGLLLLLTALLMLSSSSLCLSSVSLSVLLFLSHCV